MAVTIYKHLIEHPAGNVPMIGNSGTGKTITLKTVARFFADVEGYERFSTIIRINASPVAGRLTQLVS